MSEARRSALPPSRRQLLAAGLTGAAALAAGDTSAAAGEKRSTLGVVMYSCGTRRSQQLRSDPKSDLFEPLHFLQHCRDLGLGGAQLSLGALDKERVKAVREAAERHELFLDGIVSPPRDGADVARFEAEIETAAAVGALAVRTVVMPGRRYEQFKSMQEFRDAAAQAERVLRLAKPVVERHKVRLAVENHKDQRLDERVALYKRLDSEYIGACVDTGNNLALLDDPYAAVEALAPFAFTVHLKDHAVRENEDGFFLGEVPLGEGFFDLPRMVGVLRKAKPKLRFNLELITRDALRVPCLAESYWVTMPTVPPTDLARTLRMVRANAAKELQKVAALDPAKQVRLEDENIARSRTYARERLGF
jgi:sugar phosphate isomerase/epimerase